MNILQTFHITKKFGDTVAVNDVSISVREGEIYGFLGVNGAGKTTTIRLLLGMIRPSAGSCRLFGQEIKQGSNFYNDVGYLVEMPHSYPNLTVEENLKVYSFLRGLADKEYINKIIDKLHLTTYKDKKVKHLSMGNNQRLGLAKALIHNPKLLILDEPINGLDPEGIVEIRKFLKELVYNHNTTIFLSSHILSEISQLATRIGIIHDGKLIIEIDTDELDKQIIKKLYLNTINNEKTVQLLKSKGFNVSINNLGFIETRDIKAIKQPEVIAELLVNSNLPPKMLNIIEEDLESFFLRIIHKQKSIL
ncbi:ABC transporter ATP-binding protein [candidate division KSB1 bacterium]|nr:ABC transporter ATP-binding protein [candidate division KSB1 bacterium]